MQSDGLRRALGGLEVALWLKRTLTVHMLRIMKGHDRGMLRSQRPRADQQVCSLLSAGTRCHLSLLVLYLVLLVVKVVLDHE